MNDWDILVYLREARQWMVQSHYTREDIESMYDYQFINDGEWADFCSHACDSFDLFKKEIMDAIFETF